MRVCEMCRAFTLAFHSDPIGAFPTGLGSCSIPSQSWQMQRIGAGGRYVHMELKKTWNESRKSWKRMSSAKAFVPFVWSHLNRKMAKSKAVAFNLEVRPAKLQKCTCGRVWLILLFLRTCCCPLAKEFL